MMENILEVREASKSFGGIKALDNVNVNINKGSIIGLIGPNGSGKTTLFNVVTGFYPPDSGEIIFQGKRIDGLNPNEVFSLGLVRTFQIPRLFNRLTVLENMLIPNPEQDDENPLKALRRKSWQQQEISLTRKALELIKIFGIEGFENSRVSELSAAYMKLIETARSIMGGAKMLLLDEPAAGVNYATAKDVFEHIKMLREKYGLTLFIIEHRIEVLLDYVDYVYVLNLGRMLAEGTPKEVRENRKVIETYIGE